MKTGEFNSGDCNVGRCNSGDCNVGSFNSGDCNVGSFNSGDCNTADGNSGNFNSGGWNAGHRNSGRKNLGDFNSGNFNSGLFNTIEQNINLFNLKTNLTLEEFKNSRFYRALYSEPLNLTEWIYYTEKEMENDKAKELIRGFLKEYTYKEACGIWWSKLSKENKEIIQEIPNFNKDIFREITGIDVGLKLKI